MPRIGNYLVHAVETGHIRLDGGAMFGIVPKPLWNRKIEADDRNRITLALRCLLLEGDGRLILIDNGVGHKYDAKFADIFGVDHDTATLHGSLAELGFAPEDVTDVILTHLHFDHCGGTTERKGDSLKLTFPNAVHHVQKDHWDWARSLHPRERASFLAENLDPLEASGMLKLAVGNVEIVPGVKALVVDGHTRAQQALEISAPEHTLVYVADLIPTSAHIPSVWGMAYDIEPLKTIEEKGTFLKKAADKGWSIFFEHDTQVEVMDVEQIDGRIRGSNPRSLAEF
jgi:glyoxylase-like metal-dependent hydrolase (beta-lactamase superfamily II)